MCAPGRAQPVTLSDSIQRIRLRTFEREYKLIDSFHVRSTTARAKY